MAYDSVAAWRIVRADRNQRQVALAEHFYRLGVLLVLPEDRNSARMEIRATLQAVCRWKPNSKFQALVCLARIDNSIPLGRNWTDGVTRAACVSMSLTAAQMMLRPSDFYKEESPCSPLPLNPPSEPGPCPDAAGSSMPLPSPLNSEISSSRTAGAGSPPSELTFGPTTSKTPSDSSDKNSPSSNESISPS